MKTSRFNESQIIKAIKELGTAGAHLDISAAEQAIKHESEILSILKDHKAKKEDDRDNPVELACDLSTQYFRARDDLFMCRMNVENAIFESGFEEKFQNHWKTQVAAASRHEAKWAEAKVGHAPPHALLAHRPA